MGRLAGFLLLGLTVGGALGYLAGARRAPQRAHSDRVPAARDLPAAASPPRATPSSPASVPRGHGRITGFARTVEGGHVAGVRVVAARERGDGAWAARTDASGAYAVEGLPAERFRVSASLPGHVVEPMNDDLPPLPPGAFVDFRVSQAIPVEVDVLLVDGTRPPEAMVHLGRGEPRRWTPAARVLHVPAGRLEFRAEIGSDAPARSDEVPRRIVAGEPVDPVVLRVAARPGLAGYVRFPFGEEFPWVTVRVLKFADGEAPPVERLAADGSGTRVGPSTGWRYRVLDLAPGRYLVGVDIGEQTIVATRAVDVGSSLVACDFDIEAIDPRHYVVVHVLGPDGEPVDDVEMRAGSRRPGGGSAGGATFVRRSDKSWLVLHQMTRRDEATEFFVTAISKSYGPKQARYELDATNEVEIRYGLPATLTVELLGYRPAEHAGIFEIEVIPAPAFGSYLFPDVEEKPDEQGRATVGPFESGRCSVRVVAMAGRTWPTLEVFREDRELASGANTVAVRLPAFHELTLRTTGLDAGKARFGLYRLGRYRPNIAHGGIDEEGRCVFPRLVPGLYDIEGHGSVAGAMTIRIPGPSVIDWDPRPRTAYRAVVVGDGDLQRMGFRDGDLVLAVDGVDIEGVDHGAHLLTKSKAGGEVRLTVRRGDRVVEMRVDGAALAGGLGARGGRLYPASR